MGLAKTDKHTSHDQLVLSTSLELSFGHLAMNKTQNKKTKQNKTKQKKQKTKSKSECIHSVRVKSSLSLRVKTNSLEKKDINVNFTLKE